MGIKKQHLDGPIYRYMKLEHFESLIKNQCLYFSNIMDWDDPWENFSLKIPDENGKLKIADYGMGMFGVCWTLNENSDAFWRLYDKSDTHEVIMVESTASSVIEALKNKAPDLKLISGKVDYFKEDSCSIITKLNECESRYDRFFLKRDAFSYENEVRFLIDEQRNSEDEGVRYIYNVNKTFKIAAEIDCDLDCMINKILIHPKGAQDTAEKVADICKNNGFSFHIDRSDLYDEEWHKDIVYNKCAQRYEIMN